MVWEVSARTTFLPPGCSKNTVLCVFIPILAFNTKHKRKVFQEGSEMFVLVFHKMHRHVNSREDQAAISLRIRPGRSI